MFVCFFWSDSPQWDRTSSFTRFLEHTQGRKTVSTTPLDGWSAHRRDLYLTTHDTHNRDIHVPDRIRTRDHRYQTASDLHLRPRGHLIGNLWSSSSRWLMAIFICTAQRDRNGIGQKIYFPFALAQYNHYVGRMSLKRKMRTAFTRSL